MAIVRKIVSVLATVALAVTFVGAGFIVCTTPPVTMVFANLFSDDATSPFDRTQLVSVAEATRDYSFGAHDQAALYQAIYQVDLQLRQQIVNANGTLPYAFPNLDAVNGQGSIAQYEAAFAGASEMYCFSADTISHLDDCYDLACIAYRALAVIAVVALVGVVFCGIAGRKRLVGNVLLVAGVLVIVAVVALGAYAVLDFPAFFATFHGIFFSQGNWQFPYDSLLICALPTPFWTGMAAVWIIVTLVISALSGIIGFKVRK